SHRSCPTPFPYTTLFRSWGDRPSFPGHVIFLSRDTQNTGRWFDLGEEFNTQFPGVAVPRFAVRADGSYFDDRFASARMAINLERSEEHTSELQSRENLVC